jgi:hypothetical protein
MYTMYCNELFIWYINYVNKPLLLDAVYGATLKIKNYMLMSFIFSIVKLAKCPL